MHPNLTTRQPFLLRGAGLGALPTQDQLGEIVGKNGIRYRITPEDLLWLARSVQHEGGNYAATAWTYAQRLVLFRTSSLLRLVQAHSQPVNPIWRRDGEKCRPGGPYYGRDECSESRLAARDRASTMPWDSIRPSIRDLLLRWAKADLENPVPRATDFANAPVSRSFISRNPGTRTVLIDGNWYLSEGPSSAPGQGSNVWPADFVTIQHGGREAGPSTWARLGIPITPELFGLAVGGAAVAAGFAGWAIWYGTRRSVRRNTGRVPYAVLARRADAASRWASRTFTRTSLGPRDLAEDHERAAKLHQKALAAAPEHERRSHEVEISRHQRVAREYRAKAR